MRVEFPNSLVVRVHARSRVPGRCALLLLALLAMGPVVASEDDSDPDYARGYERFEPDPPHRDVEDGRDLLIDSLPLVDPAAGATEAGVAENPSADGDVIPSEAARTGPPVELAGASGHPAAGALDDTRNGPPRWGRLHLLGGYVDPGQRVRLEWTASESFAGTSVRTPVIVVHGGRPGPTLCLTAAVHGDELNGVEVVRRIIHDLQPEQLSGTVIGVPIVNLFGFSRGSRYLPDRRDLNRFFPGNPSGSAAARIAFSFFREIAQYCEMLVDFHTGSFDRTNLPQLRADLSIPEVLEFTRKFGGTAVLHTAGDRGMLRRALTDRNRPAVTFEIGAPLRLEPAEIEQGVRAIETLMQRLGMTPRPSRRTRTPPQPVYYESRWVRANMGGMLFSEVELGERVRQGQRLGRVIDPLTNQQSEIRSPVTGRVLGKALNQVVLPGYASYHIGVAAPEDQLVRDPEDLDYEPVPEHDRLDDGWSGDPDAEGAPEPLPGREDPAPLPDPGELAAPQR